MENKQRQTISKEQLFIQLNMRALDAQKQSDLQFIICNESNQLVPYQQAAFFNINPRNKPQLSNVSGLVDIENNAPFSIWLNQLADYVNTDAEYQTLMQANAPKGLMEDWQEWLPESTLWIPLRNHKQQLIGLSMFAKASAWAEVEAKQLGLLHKPYAHALDALQHNKKTAFSQFADFFKFNNALMVALILSVLMFIPVRLSALAPAEVIALDALSVAAPQDGVIETFFVEPNQTVKQGDLLFTLDNTGVNNRYQVAVKALAVAQADALVVNQRAFNSPEGKAALASAIGKVHEKEAELASIQSLMSRIEIRAEHDGLAIFTDKNDWIGRPVQTGERVMRLANPKDTGLLVWLPTKDALNLEKGAEMKMFMHTDPLHPITAKLVQTSYQSTLSPDNVASYRLKGVFDEADTLPRIGLAGTARISGKKSFLGYYLFRRPIAAVREWTGI
jgi:phosphotransferase system IIA component